MNFLLVVPINQDQLVPDKLVRTLLAKVKSQSDATLALFRLLACESFHDYLLSHSSWKTINVPEFMSSFKLVMGMIRYDISKKRIATASHFPEFLNIYLKKAYFNFII